MTDQTECRVEMVALENKLDNIILKVDDMHTALFGNGDYKNNLVTDVQENTSFRNGMTKGMWAIVGWGLSLTVALILLGVKLLTGV